MAELEFRHEIIDEETPGWENDVCVVGDVDGDGLDDFIIGAKEGQGNLVWYRAPDWRRFKMSTASLEAGGVLVDITGDGTMDFVAGRHADGKELYWFEHPADPTKEWTRRLIDNTLERYHDQAAGDVDGDGKMEILVASQNAKVLCYYDIPADPTVSPWPAECRHVIFEGETLEGVAVADVDGDGQIEVIGGANIFKKQGGHWTRRNFADYHWPALTVADINGDGVPEIILAEGESDPARLAWFSAPDFEEHLLADDLFHPHSLAVADFDGDGRPDIFAGEMGLGKNDSPRMIIFLNRGEGRFEPVVIDEGRATHCATVIRVKGAPLPSIVGKPYDPGRHVDLWVNVTGR